MVAKKKKREKNKEEEGAACHSSRNEMNHAVQVASISLHDHSHRDIPLRSISENTQFYYPVKLYTAHGLLIFPQLQWSESNCWKPDMLYAARTRATCERKPDRIMLGVELSQASAFNPSAHLPLLLPSATREFKGTGWLRTSLCEPV